MLRAIAAVSVLAAFALLFAPLPASWTNQQMLPTLTLERFSAAEQLEQESAIRCEARRCLVVYVAPWCPHCHAARPMIQTLSAELLSDGIPTAVVVGADSRESCADFASSFTDTAYLDPDEAFYDEASLQGVPAFMVVDQKGQILQVMPGYVPEAGLMREALGL